MGTKIQTGIQWLERAAGQQLDALEDTLAAYREDDIRSRQALHRQLQRIEKASLKAGFTGTAAMAAQVLGAADGSVRPLCSALTALLRAAIRSARRPEDQAGADIDVPQIALCRHQGGCAIHGLRQEEAPAGTLVLHIENLEAIRQRHGDAGTEEARLHVLRVLRKLLRAGDCLATTGTHCFVVFLPGEDACGLRAAFERMRAAVLRTPWTRAERAPEGLRLALCAAPAGVHIAGETAGTQKRPPARVAVISHRPAFARILDSILAPAGGTVSTSGAPGSDTWAGLKRQPPRVVVVDVPAHELESVLDELADALRGRRIPVVALVENESASALALEHGVRAALPKPVRPDELLATFRRIVRRGKASADATAEPAGDSTCILVASDSVPQLIAIGTSLQKRIGGSIRLCRGTADAAARAKEYKPDVAVLDLSLQQADTTALLKTLASRMPAPRIVLIAEALDAGALSAHRMPGVAAVIPKPVSLLDLPERIAKAAGLLPAASAGASFDLFRTEVQRVVSGLS